MHRSNALCDVKGCILASSLETMIHKEMEPTNNESEQKGNEGRAVRGPEILVYIYMSRGSG